MVFLLSVSFWKVIFLGKTSSAGSSWFHCSACPSFPLYPHPHVNIFPYLEIAILWLNFSPREQETEIIFSFKSELIILGFCTFDLSPCPSWLKLPWPQEKVLPSKVIAKEWVKPALTFENCSSLQIGLNLQRSLSV